MNLLVFDAVVGRKRVLCIECLTVWESNGMEVPDTSDVERVEQDCEQCLDDARMAEEQWPERDDLARGDCEC